MLGGTSPHWKSDRSPMMLTMGVALCVLPFVFALVTWWRGLQAAVGATFVVLVGLAVVCWLLCAAPRRRDRGP